MHPSCQLLHHLYTAHGACVAKLGSAKKARKTTKADLRQTQLNMHDYKARLDDLRTALAEGMLADLGTSLQGKDFLARRSSVSTAVMTEAGH